MVQLFFHSCIVLLQATCTYQPSFEEGSKEGGSGVPESIPRECPEGSAIVGRFGLCFSFLMDVHNAGHVASISGRGHMNTSKYKSALNHDGLAILKNPYLLMWHRSDPEIQDGELLMGRAQFLKSGEPL